MVTAKKPVPKRQSPPARVPRTAAAAAPAPIRTARTASALTIRLVRAAKHQASIAGWSFAPDCMNYHLKPFLEQGSATLFASGKAGDVASLVAMEAATRYLVSRMIMEGDKLGLSRLQETTFLNVRPIFCPCFPFC